MRLFCTFNCTMSHGLHSSEGMHSTRQPLYFCRRSLWSSASCFTTKTRMLGLCCHDLHNHQVVHCTVFRPMGDQTLPNRLPYVNQRSSQCISHYIIVTLLRHCIYLFLSCCNVLPVRTHAIPCLHPMLGTDLNMKQMHTNATCLCITSKVANGCTKQ